MVPTVCTFMIRALHLCGFIILSMRTLANVGDVCLLGTTMFGDMDAIMAETCVLTPKESNTWKLRLDELMSFIDPDNVLQSIVDSGKYQFTEYNIVQYSQMIPDEMEG